MSWPDDILSGSFRGVPFECVAHAAQGGRRLALHEYPRPTDGSAPDLPPYTEDLGGKAKGYQLTIYVAGLDYLRERNALIKALDTAGPGTLIHPWLGELQVAVEDYSLEESPDAGARAAFTVTFREHGAQGAPLQGRDAGAEVAYAAEDAWAALVDAVADAISVVATPAYVLVATALAIEEAVEAVRDASGGETTPALDEIAEDSTGQARDPSGLGSAWVDVLSEMDDLTQLDSLTADAGEETAGPAATPALEQQRQNLNHVLRLRYSGGLIRACEIIAATEYESYDEAVAARERYAARLDAEIGCESAGRLSERLAELKAALLRDLLSRAEQLPRLIDYEIQGVTSTWELSQLLYGTGERAEEIRLRNRIAHPGFVSGTVKVLSA